MSLNNLSRAAVLLTALASVVPNAGCNKTEQSTDDAQSTQAASAPLEPGGKKFPDCGKGMKILENGRLIGVPLGSPEENFNCADDHFHGRDCHSIREERRRRIAEIPSLFRCKNGQITLAAKPSQLAVLTDFDPAEFSIKGDCRKTAAEAKVRVLRVLDRMACDKEGKPYEKLGFGQDEGGRTYNPCAGGKC